MKIDADEDDDNNNETDTDSSSDLEYLVYILVDVIEKLKKNGDSENIRSGAHS